MTSLATRVRLLGLLAAVLAVGGAATVGTSAPGETLRVSVPSAGGEANNDSTQGSISADGRYVAFASAASNLVPGDTNGVTDVFVRDRQAGTTVRASVATGGGQANGASSDVEISADGSVVVFSSAASNLVPGDTNGVLDIFVHELGTGTTTRVNLTVAGGQANFASTAPSVSGDGRYVAYSTSANNIVPSDLNAGADIFVYDRVAAATERISLSSAGGPPGFGEECNNPSISDDGTMVAFQVSAPAPSGSPGLDPADTNGRSDVYVRDRSAGTTTRVSLSSGGAQGDGHSTDPVLSGDGSTVAYASAATNLVAGDTNGDTDVFVTELGPATTEIVSVTSAGAAAVGASVSPALSADGSFVAFESAAPNLVSGDTNAQRDIFVRDRANAKTTRESLSHAGLQASGPSLRPTVSADGHLIAFHSLAGDLVAGDTNNRSDVFVHEYGVADVTPPVVTGVPATAPNGDGWYNADVTIDWQSADPAPSSGTPSDPPDTIAATEGQNVLYTSDPSCDPNGNCATGQLTLSLDKTPPTIVPSLPGANAFDWYDRNVLVGWQCADSMSGLASCTSPQLLTTEGAGQSVTGTATDRAGNQATATTPAINIDKTPPVITFTGATSYGIDDIVDVECDATDALSGIATESCPDVTAPAYLFTPGGNAISATATDKADNTTQATFAFTITISGGSLGDLACQFLGSSGRAKAVCRKLERLAADAAASTGKTRDRYIREFQQTASKESGRLLTAEQVALLVRFAAGLGA